MEKKPSKSRRLGEPTLDMHDRCDLHAFMQVFSSSANARPFFASSLKNSLQRLPCVPESLAMTHLLTPMQSCRVAGASRIQFHNRHGHSKSSIMHRQPSPQGLVSSHLCPSFPAVNVAFPVPETRPQSFSIPQYLGPGKGDGSVHLSESDHATASPIASFWRLHFPITIRAWLLEPKSGLSSLFLSPRGTPVSCKTSLYLSLSLCRFPCPPRYFRS